MAHHGASSEEELNQELECHSTIRNSICFPVAFSVKNPPFDYCLPFALSVVSHFFPSHHKPLHVRSLRVPPDPAPPRAWLCAGLLHKQGYSGHKPHTPRNTNKRWGRKQNGNARRAAGPAREKLLAGGAVGDGGEWQVEGVIKSSRGEGGRAAVPLPAQAANKRAHARRRGEWLLLLRSGAAQKPSPNLRREPSAPSPVYQACTV